MRPNQSLCDVVIVTTKRVIYPTLPRVFAQTVDLEIVPIRPALPGTDIGQFEVNDIPAPPDETGHVNVRGVSLVERCV